MLDNRYFEIMQESTGSLQVQVNDTNIGKPISNVQVAIKNENGDTVEELITDSSGQTPVINLPTPPVEYSLGEEQSVLPYAIYSIETTTNDFRKVFVNGTQVLPNSLALQEINTELINTGDTLPIEINI